MFSDLWVSFEQIFPRNQLITSGATGRSADLTLSSKKDERVVSEWEWERERERERMAREKEYNLKLEWTMEVVSTEKSLNFSF